MFKNTEYSRIIIIIIIILTILILIEADPSGRAV
jgi:hypothetical protein